MNRVGENLNKKDDHLETHETFKNDNTFMSYSFVFRPTDRRTKQINKFRFLQADGLT